jgi:SAM-dependent methyltransferase
MPGPVPTAADFAAEDARIRAAYARRTDADRYSWFNDAHMLAVQERERHTLDLLREHGFQSLDTARVLDVGCGSGFWLREMVKWGARPHHVMGVDLLPDRIAEAERRCAPGVTLVCGNAAAVEVPRESFDIVLQSMLFTSVLDADLRQAVARAMLDAVRPDGLILWYDYHVSNPRNRDVRGVSRAEIRSLFPGCRIDLRRLTLAAPIARVVAGSRVVHALLHAVPLLRTHYLGVIRKAGR